MVTAAAAIAAIWIVPFALGGRVRLGTSAHRRRSLSAAGGSAIAYVFVDLLPEMQSDLILPTLMGFIAGGVALNSVKGELPEEGEAPMVPFVTGAFAYAVLLLAIG